MKKSSKKSIPAWRELNELKNQVAKTEEPPQRDIEDVTLGGLKFPRRSLPSQKEVQESLAYIFDRLVRTNYIHFTWKTDLGAALYLWLDSLKGTYYDIYRSAVLSNRQIRSAVLVLHDEARDEDKEQYSLSSLVLEDLKLPDPIMTPPRKSAFDDEEDEEEVEVPVKQPKKAKAPFRPRIDSNWEQRLQSVNDAIVTLGQAHNELTDKVSALRNSLNAMGEGQKVLRSRINVVETRSGTWDLIEKDVNKLKEQMRNLDVHESEDESVPIDPPTDRKSFTAWDIKWVDKFRDAELLRVLNEEISSSEAQRLVNDLNRVLTKWVRGDPTHQVFSRDVWPTEPYDETDDNLTLYSAINRFFPTMGVAHNSEDLTFVLYSKT